MKNIFNFLKNPVFKKIEFLYLVIRYYPSKPSHIKKKWPHVE